MIYCTSYCNKGHDTADGKPVGHECRIIPPAALRLEMAGQYDKAIEILRSAPKRYMRRGKRVS